MKPSLIGEPEIILRDRLTIDDYLFEAHSKYSKLDAQKMFDCLDFIFIDGDPNLLPWMRQCEKFALLFRMCKITNKCLFSAGIGLMLLVYWCATNFASLKVINGGGKGSNLNEIHQLKLRKIQNLAKDEVFLDNATGDYYTFRKDTEVWTPLGNTGIHNSNAAEQYGGMMMKTKTYRPKNLNQVE